MKEIEQLKMALALVGIQIELPALNLLLLTQNKVNEVGDIFSIKDASELININNETFKQLSNGN